VSPVIGIDLGTTNAVVAAVVGGTPRVIPNAWGATTTPAVVAFDPATETLLVGNDALNWARKTRACPVRSIARLLGQDFNAATRGRSPIGLSVEWAPGESGEILVGLGGRWRSVPDLVAAILARLKADATREVGSDASQAVLVIPSHADFAYLGALRSACHVAGIQPLRFLGGATAVGVAYGVTHPVQGRTLVVCDFGGGSFDAAVLQYGGGVYEVEAIASDRRLGGVDVDLTIVDWLVATYRKETQVELDPDGIAYERLEEAAEKAKIELSSSGQSQIDLPYIAGDSSAPRHLAGTLTRVYLNQLAAPMIQRAAEVIRTALRNANRTPEKIDGVILSGGMSRMRAVQDKLREIFGKPPILFGSAEHNAALGAAVQAGTLEGQIRGVLLLDASPLTVGVETQGGVMTPLIPRNSKIPTRKRQTFSTAGYAQSSVEVRVLAGERPGASENRLIGRLVLDGIERAARGKAEIEVDFDIDANGILTVKVTDKSTGRSQHMTFSASGAAPGSALRGLPPLEPNRSLWMPESRK
jgi:molecular chaperone DnaK